jgi:hypothetical protein
MIFFEKKIAQNEAQSFFVSINTYFLAWKISSQTSWTSCEFSSKYPEKTIAQ